MISSLILSLALQAMPEAEPSANDIAYLTACAGSEAGLRAHGCIGMVSSQCQASHDAGYSTLGMVICTQRELAIWDQRLNAAYSALMTQYGQLDSDSRQNALREAQRAWMAYRDSECLQTSLIFEGGTAQNVVHAGCLNDMTAKRALELEVQASEPY